MFRKVARLNLTRYIHASMAGMYMFESSKYNYTSSMWTLRENKIPLCNVTKSQLKDEILLKSKGEWLFGKKTGKAEQLQYEYEYELQMRQFSSACDLLNDSQFEMMLKHVHAQNDDKIFDAIIRKVSCF